ncbi:MAG: hypothetical protein E7641_08050 [Ruminococcaceae bacterium]|nr:hypothetical protein [Oscillospiraceae bacterium]
MCTIAGYAGKRRAAPILIEMMKKEEFMDGGLSTGIATIHEGKLYTAKVTGDLETLLRETDAADLPGTVGIIHSRTGGNLVSHAHPFKSADGELGLVLNGTLREVKSPEFFAASNEIMNGFYEKGVHIDSAYKSSRTNPETVLPNGLSYHDTEPYALMIGEYVENTAPENMKKEMMKATVDALTRLTADIIVLSVHARLPDTITLGTITRPMNCGFGDGETYLATSAIAFPDEVQKRPVIAIPPTSVAQVTPDGITFSNEKIEGVRVEQIDYRIAAYIHGEMEKLLKEKHIGVPEMPCYTDWRGVWSEPSVECKFASPTGLLKPYATILYEGLWSFHKEGRLHSAVETNERGTRVLRFWLD